MPLEVMLTRPFSAGELKDVPIDVYAANFANLFPLVEATRQINNVGDPKFPQFCVHEYDWSWSYSSRKPQKRTDYRLPFSSSAEYQLFFATESEFQELEDFGIDFLPIPVTAYNPAFVFCSAADERIARKVIRILGDGMKKAGVLQPFAEPLVARLPDGSQYPCTECRAFRPGEEPISTDRTELQPIWISDAPDQARLVAEWFDGLLRPDFDIPQGIPEPILWNTRKLDNVLKEVSDQASGKSNNTIKFFVWGGPMTSRAKYDIRWCQNQQDRTACNERMAKSADRLTRPNTRAHDRSTFAVRLPLLSRWSGDAIESGNYISPIAVSDFHKDQKRERPSSKRFRATISDRTTARQNSGSNAMRRCARIKSYVRSRVL